MNMLIYQNFLILIFALLRIECEVYAHEPKFNVADMEFTTVVEARKRECFYQYAKPKQTLRFEYRVVDAGFSKLGISRDLKISFYVRSPKKETIVQEVEKSQSIKTYKVKEVGDYEMCLDNSFSKLFSKTVYFEVSIDVNSEGYRWNMIKEMIESDKKKNDTISRLKRAANKVKDDLDHIKHFQDTFRAVEARDINFQENNLTKVHAFSSLTTVLMMLFGATHLFVLKSIFNPSSVLAKILRKIC